MNKFEYGVAANLEGAFEFLKEPGAKVKAGGIDLLDLMKEGFEQPVRLVNIKSIKDLDYIKKDKDGSLRIGATTVLADIAANKDVMQNYLAVSQAAKAIATPQIRNLATVGGNLCQRPRCWYFRSEDFKCYRKGGEECFAEDGENKYHAILGNKADCVMVHPSGMAVALMAFDAKLVIKNGKKEREIELADFWLTPEKDITRENNLVDGEIITEIILPKPKKNVRSFYFKQKEKQSFDWPLADVAVALEMDGNSVKDSRVIFGSAAPIPWRAKEAEKALKGKTVSVKSAKDAASAELKNANPLAQNEYKVAIFNAVTYRTICWAAGVDPFA